MFYLFASLLMFFFIRTNNLEQTLFYSIFEQKTKYKTIADIILSLLFPITIIFILKNRKQMSFKKSNPILLLVICLSIILIPLTVKSFVEYSNQKVEYKESYNELFLQRGTIHDLMMKKVSQTLQVAKIVDTSYAKQIVIIADARKGGEQEMWKWVQESNPNANYGEVVDLYKNVQSIVSNSRDNLLIVEVKMQNIVKQWNLLHNKIPSKFFLKSESLNYKPILSSISEEANRTSIDNNFSL